MRLQAWNLSKPRDRLMLRAIICTIISISVTVRKRVCMYMCYFILGDDSAGEKPCLIFDLVLE